MHKLKYFLLIRVNIEKKVSEVRKKRKTYDWQLDLSKKMEN